MGRLKNKSNKIFIVIEILLGIVGVILAFLMLNSSPSSLGKVAVVIPDSDASQWTALKQGLKAGAKDHHLDLLISDTPENLTGEKQLEIIQQEIKNGAKRIICQSLVDLDEKKLAEVTSDVPVLFINNATKETAKVLTPDFYSMGQALGNELIQDYEGHLTGKTIGLLGKNKTPSIEKAMEGFKETIASYGGEISWEIPSNIDESESMFLNLSKVNFMIAFDDASSVFLGNASLNNNLKGALAYGIGHSTEAMYLLDHEGLRSLVIPDEFNLGYKSVVNMEKSLSHPFGEKEKVTISFSVLKKDELYLKENQDLLFMMNQL